MTTIASAPALTIPISPDAPYVVVDARTGKIVYTTTWARRNAARSRADRLDLEYGAVRYVSRLAQVVAL